MSRAHSRPDSMSQVTAELAALAHRVDVDAVDVLVEAITAARRVFVTGRGRSRLMGAALTMRLMHLGLNTHLVGDVTTPAIGSGDLLIVISSSGASGSTVNHATVAQRTGASIVAVTTALDSALGALADTTVLIPIGPNDAQPTRQHAGSLFEQAVLILGDATAHRLMAKLDRSDADLDRNHDNLP